MTKQKLSDFFKLQLQDKFGSMAVFSETTDGFFTYARLKKNVHLNSFSRQDVSYLVENLGLAGFDLNNYEVRISRRHRSPRVKDIQRLRSSMSELISPEHVDFVVKNPDVLKRIRGVANEECRRIKEILG
jgi:hypothetical protein